MTNSSSNQSKKLNLSEIVERKFVESFDINDWEIETENGFVDATQIHKTIEYEVYEIKLENNLSLRCADTHILIDEFYEEVFAIDSLNRNIRTKQGISKVTSVENLGYSEHMYDITVDSDEHTFYSNDILSHNTTALVAAVLHYAIFNDEKTVAVLANKRETALEILGRIQLAYENLPSFLQHGIITFNKSYITLENKSRIMAFASSSGAIRGYSINFLFIDESAHLENWTEFYTSVYPTISSGKESKIVLVSTPLGLNYYYKLWMDAINGLSEYIPIKVTWRDVPGRDEEWKRQQIANTSIEQFTQEHEAEFVGSAGTLIDGWRLKEIFETLPIKFSKTMRQFKEYVEGHNYVIVADVSRGKGIDNSAFIVVDVTQIPYEVVTTYYCNNITPDLFAETIYQASVYYKDAYVLVENNDAGCQTIQVLNDTYECENIMGTRTNPQAQKVISINGGSGFEFGVRTTKTIKAVGASRLKILVEQYSFVFGCSWLIDELNKFIRVGKSYEAQKDAHDDLVMCALLFAWLTTQDLFEDLTSINTTGTIRLKNEDRMANEMMPIGYVLDGIDTYGDDTLMELLTIQLPDYDEEFLNNINYSRATKEERDEDDNSNFFG